MLIDQIRQQMQQAMKAQDKIGTLARQLLLAEIHNREIQKQTGLSDEEIWSVIRQQIKQRQESITAYQAGKRDDLVKQERQELEILSKYLPQEISDQDLGKIVRQVINDVEAVDQKDFGKVMGEVMKQVKGKTDGDTVAKIVGKILN